MILTSMLKEYTSRAFFSFVLLFIAIGCNHHKSGNNYSVQDVHSGYVDSSIIIYHAFDIRKRCFDCSYSITFYINGLNPDDSYYVQINENRIPLHVTIDKYIVTASFNYESTIGVLSGCYYEDLNYLYSVICESPKIYKYSNEIDTSFLLNTSPFYRCISKTISAIRPP